MLLGISSYAGAKRSHQLRACGKLSSQVTGKLLSSKAIGTYQTLFLNKDLVHGLVH